MQIDDPLQEAQAAKNKGNKYFKAQRYAQAIDCYTQALAVCPADRLRELATFYQNRAAAYEQQVGNRLPRMCGQRDSLFRGKNSM